MASRHVMLVAMAAGISTLATSTYAQTPALDACKAQVARAAAAQGAKAQSLANLNIDPARTTLKELRAALGEEGLVSASGTIRNSRVVYWLLGPIGSVEYATEHCKDWGPTPSKSLFSSAVQATFLSSSDTIDEGARPIAMEISPPFAGTLRRLRITDPESRIVELGTRSGFKPSTGSPNAIRIEGGWEVRWNLDGNPQRRQYIELRALGYITIPR